MEALGEAGLPGRTAPSRAPVSPIPVTAPAGRGPRGRARHPGRTAAAPGRRRRRGRTGRRS